MEFLPDELLEPGPIKEVRVDFNERCNLRCVYCSVSSANYNGIEMPSSITRQAIDIISRLSLFNPGLEVDVNGNGETTFRNDWTELVRPLFEVGIPVRIQSNFAKEFKEDELRTLACMKAITISIDTADRRLLRKVRRHVDLHQVITNIVLVRAAAISMIRKPPLFIFACGLYDKNSLHVEALAQLAASIGIKIVDFWDLHDHGHLDNGVTAEDRVKPLAHLDDADLFPRLEAIRRAIAFLTARGIIVSVHGDFVSALAKRVGLDG
jgi:MoaA/NifB/PqqE/SkfB family radical SAM enzyme